MRVVNPAATALMGAFFLLANLGVALYSLAGREPSGGFVFLGYVCFGVAVAYWIHSDNQRLGKPEAVDQGWLAFALWPMVLPYHLYRSRGYRGALTLLGLIGLFAATYAISLAVFFALRSRPAS